MNICHFFKVDELLKLRTDSEYSLLNTKKVSCCFYFCAMINFLMNHRRKYVSFFFLFSPSSKHLSLFLFKYYSIIFFIKKRGISGHLEQMRTKNVRISLNRLVYAIWRLTKTVVKRQKSSKYDVYIFIFCMYGNCHTSFHHLEVALKAY